MHAKRLSLLCLLSFSCVPEQRETSVAVSPTFPEKIGEMMTAEEASPSISARPREGRSELVWSRSFVHSNATYIAVHFSKFALPEGARVVVRAPNGDSSLSYSGVGKAGSPGNFWARHVPGREAIVELYSPEPLEAGAIAIDGFARGFQSYEMQSSDFQAESICGADDSDWARCFETSEPEIYQRSRAVARLMINGVGACTGWLVGSEGHLFTNQHCIGDAATAANTDFEFMAEGATCATDCASFGACPGIVEADTSSLIAVDAGFDYALVQLPNNVSSTYGFFQLRPTGAVLNERIYLSGHPAAFGKRLSVTAEGDVARVNTLSAAACSNAGTDVGYNADTQGGSSGSPVIAFGDHLVVALHHCGGCPNLGVPIQDVISDLGPLLPPSALPGGGCTPQPIASAGPDRSICPGESVTLGTAARPDHAYSWSTGDTTAEISVSPGVTTTFTLTAQTACGTAQDSVTVSVGSGGSFADDFEGDTSGWTASGQWHLVDGSACGAPGFSSATHAMYFGQDAACSYNTGSATTGDLTSPQIAAVDPSAVLRFDFFRQVESDAGSFDRAEVQASTDGTTFTTIWSRSSANVSENAWTPSGDISLAAFAGQPLRIRFRFDSVDGVANTFVGWMIDDVEIAGPQTCDTPNVPPSATIVSPADGAVIDEGQSVTLSGSANDQEDGDLSANLAWTSSLDGALGSGASVSAVLSVGTHQISATVIDSDGASASAQIAVTVRAAPTGFLESFESGAAGWTTTALWHLVDGSACGAPGFSSPTHAMYFGQDAACTYNTGSAAVGALTSPSIGGVSAGSVLRFSFFRQVESFAGGSFDQTTVAISGDGGATFTEVFSRDSAVVSENAWTPSGDISLAAFAGQSIVVRFTFDSVDNVANSFTGWMIDDVEVR